LELGRFEQAQAVLVKYFNMFVGEQGEMNMRGLQVGQFGLILNLLAKHATYTRGLATLERHKSNIVGSANILIRLHDESLALLKSDPGYALIHGWSESDACLRQDPSVFWKPYYSNSAFAVRGLLIFPNFLCSQIKLNHGYSAAKPFESACLER